MTNEETLGECGLNDGLGHVACATCGEQPYYTKAHINSAVAAERERWSNLLRATGRVIQAFDDGGLRSGCRLACADGVCEKMKGTHIVVTRIGTEVRLSKKTLAWLNAIDPKWREIAANKRRQGHWASLVRDQVRRVEEACNVAAEIEFTAGGCLEEF